MHASLNVGYQGKSSPGKIHEVILVNDRGRCFFRLVTSAGQRKNSESPWGIERQTFGFPAPML